MARLDDYLFTLDICLKHLPPDAHPAHEERIREIKEIVREKLQSNENGGGSVKRNKSKPSGLHVGDMVVMHTCIEAEKYNNKVWKVRSEPWDLCGSEVVLLEGYSGGFATQFLKKFCGVAQSTP